MGNTNYSDYSIYTTKQEIDKALNTLKGILLGIKIDSKIKEVEIKELKLWTLTHANLISKNPFREFMITINLIIETNQFDLEVIEDMYWTCENMEVDNIYYNQVTSDLQILQGLCHGILSDGIINDTEIVGLHDWLDDHQYLNTFYPYDELFSLILDILSDGVVDEDERKRLIAYFNQFVSLKNPEIKSQLDQLSKGIPINGICTANPEVDFDGKVFCFTGEFINKTKDQLQEDIEYWGGIYSNSVTKKLDYLIVADNGNPAWAFSCYGRKVEKALKYRKQGVNISIIHEFDFNDILADK